MTLNIPALREAAAAFREKQEAATEGPWQWREGESREDTLANDVALSLVSIPKNQEVITPFMYGGFRRPWMELRESDAEFIAHARNTTLAADVARLCDRVEELERRIDWLEKELGISATALDVIWDQKQEEIAALRAELAAAKKKEMNSEPT